MSDKYDRMVKKSVTCFLYYRNEYLLLKRSENKRIDPNKLNGVGGKLEQGEDYLTAAIRETEEETGYKISPENIKLSGVVILEGGYSEDWVMCFFKIKVESKNIPLGTKTEDGELLWIHKDKVLDSEYEVVDDLNYCFGDIVNGDKQFFITAQMDKDEKVYSTSIGRIDV